MIRRWLPNLAFVFWCVTAVAACGGDDAPPIDPPTDVSSADDAGVSGDAPFSDTSPSLDNNATDGAEPWAPPPVAEPEEPQPIEIAEWRVTTLDPSNDMVGDAVEFGTFTYPEAGSSHGAFWSNVPTGEGGAIPLNGPGAMFYAAARIEVDEATAVIAVLDGVATAFISGERYPGDPYISGRHRVPLHLDAGENLVVLRGFRRNNPPKVRFEAVTHELVFNLSDMTVGDLELGAPHDQWVGLPVLNTTGSSAVDCVARVVESEQLEATAIEVATLPAASIQVPFQLVPKAALPTDGTPIQVTLRVESPSLEWSYEMEVELPTRELGSGAVVRRAFRSSIDRSVQQYAVREPTSIEDGKQYSLVLSLHGAGVGAKGQAGSYGAKDWNYLVAATNRRPFGFDWESFGRLDGLEVLNKAEGTLPIDPTRVYVTGHSMGGHGTWQFGHLFPGRFALVGPSAGWISFATYTGPAFPTGAFGWASLSSQTQLYSKNLKQRAVYIVHGTADDNVPVSQAYDMLELLGPIVEDLHSHFEEGAGHWWNGDKAAGADCVDWPPMFELMQERTLDLTELDFEFISPSPSVSPTHSYVTVLSAESPAAPFELTSSVEGSAVGLVTQNVRGLVLDGAALMGKGVETLTVDGEAVSLTDGPIEVGPQTGKRPAAYGPLVQAFQQPFCLVWADTGPVLYANYARYLLTTWNIIGNGTGCALPLSQVTDAVRAQHNLIYLGVPRAEVPLPESMDMDWDDLSVSVDGNSFDGAALGFVFPSGEKLGAVLVTARTQEHLLFRISPFNSRFWIPDWLVFGEGGGEATGFFGPDWTISPQTSFF